MERAPLAIPPCFVQPAQTTYKCENFGLAHGKPQARALHSLPALEMSQFGNTVIFMQLNVT